jgi:hypothetical protein
VLRVYVYSSTYGAERISLMSVFRPVSGD